MKPSDHQVSGLQETTSPETIIKPALFILPLFLFILLSFIIYIPVLDRYFVSDDFKVLYRVCVDHILFIKGFFRPLSDISIYMNYRIGGLNPVVFNSFNILIHGINSYLIYLICLFFGYPSRSFKKKRFAIFCSLIFLTYPFHNEAVVWLLGRGASLACLFCLLSLISYYTISGKPLKTILVCLFYFISMSAFESTILFPFIFLLLLMYEKRKGTVLRFWVMVLSSTLFMHFLLRYWISRTILGTYGRDFFHSGINNYLFNLVKITGRLVLPPSLNAFLLSTLFVLIIALSGWLLFRNFHKIRALAVWREIQFLSGMLLISCIIPIVSGVSTQTSETDRALYFPSVFLSLILGSLIVFVVKKSRNQLILLVLILSYNLFFLERNNQNWKNASRITALVMKKITDLSRTGETGGKVYMLNIPKEIDGAYVFRQGFMDALRVYKLDTTRFVVVNYLTRQDLEKMKVIPLPDPENEQIHLLPDILMVTNTSGCREVYDHGVLKFRSRPGDRIFFWNMDQLQEIQACLLRKPT